MKQAIDPIARHVEYRIGRAGTNSHDVIIGHHERQSAINFQRMLIMVGDDRVLLSFLQATRRQDLSTWAIVLGKLCSF